LAAALAVVVGGAGAVGILAAAEERSDEVERVPDVVEVLATDDDGPAENYLLVGSDTREGIKRNAPDADAFVGDEDQVTGRRSDTIMILRREKDGGAALLSLPRDLWVTIDGTGEEDRINSAYSMGADRLAATISNSLGIPIHHYVEIDFVGFRRLVNAVGGVEVCVPFATRDTHSGLSLQPGCQVLDGAQALAYARSRHYEEFRDGDWQLDESADLGRIARQQAFIRTAVGGLLKEVESDPFALGDLLSAATKSVRIDSATDPEQAARALRAAADEGLRTFTLPVENTEIDGKSVLLLLDEADAVLDYFRGVGPAPEPPPTTVAG
jgi:LCP family protein required for cell wall assembly